MAESKNQNYLHGAAILTIAVAIVKVLGAIYKIPINNNLGDEGFGLFNMAYNIYAVVLALSTAGLPVAVSRMISEANNSNRPLQVKRIFSTATVAFIILGAVGSAAMFIFPVELADFMGDVRASQAIQVLAPSVLLCCLMSAFRGYLQGLSDMRPTAISQVIEVAVKVVFGLALLYILKYSGASNAVLLSGATAGVPIGSLLACLYIGAVAIRRMRKEERRLGDADIDKTVGSKSSIVKGLVIIGVPIAFGACVLAIMNLANTKVIVERLTELFISNDGMSKDLARQSATGLYGVYSQALLMYNLPYAIITPLTVSVVPAISGYLALKKHYEAKTVVESSLRISAIIALPMGVGMTALAQPIMSTVLKSNSEQSGGLLAIMGISSFFLCLAMMAQAILQASGKERLPAITMIIGGVLTIVINWYLLAIPEINVYGAAIGYFVGNLFMFVANLFFVSRQKKQKPLLKRVFVMPVINSALMGLAAWLLYPAMLKILGAGPDPSRIISYAALGVTVGVAAVIYVVLTVITQAITIEDMKLLPKGERIAKLLHIK